MATARGINPFLKAALPTRVLKRRGQSLHQRTPGPSPYDTGAGSHTSCKLARKGRSQTAARQCRASSTAEPVPQLEATLRMAQQCQSSTSITGQSATGGGATVDMAKSGPAVMAAAGERKQQSNHLQAHVPSWSSRGALSHDVKTTRPCAGPRTARATTAPRTTCPVALIPWQGKRHLWQAKQASFHLRHDDRVKKGVPHHLNSYPFPLPLSLFCYMDRERRYFERDPSPRRKQAPSPPTDQGFEGWLLGRVRQPP
jgi:dienelactone hydrolase